MTTTDTTTDEQIEATAEIPQSDAPEEAAPVDDAAPEAQEEGEPDTFDRAYVEKLRAEAARYRARAKAVDDAEARADQYARRLHEALVAASGRLADPTDLPYDPAHLDDADALGQAIDELLAAKPHLAARRPRGDIGQGRTSSATGVDLAALLRSTL